MKPLAGNKSTGRALQFVVLVGLVSLFADMTYESARSITGPYLYSLGASAFAVSFAAGFGELSGYGLRLLSGRLADRTRRYWTFTIVGYTVNLISVPLLAFAGKWPWAVALIVAERIGKAIRTPSRDAMLSHAGEEIGAGRAFGLHKLLDQLGAVAGPLILAFVFKKGGDFRTAFLMLGVPALFALATLFWAQRLFPRPSDLSAGVRFVREATPRRFWIYLVATCLIAAAYADFPLIAFHLGKTKTVSAPAIPLLYALAMAVSAGAAFFFGRLYDRFGLRVLGGAALLSAGFAPLAFQRSAAAAVGGVVLWGIGMGTNESVMRAALAKMAPPDRRATAYGIFNAAFGASWFAGSLALGWLYGRSVPGLIGLSAALQIIAAGLFVTITRAD